MTEREFEEVGAGVRYAIQHHPATAPVADSIVDAFSDQDKETIMKRQRRLLRASVEAKQYQQRAAKEAERIRQQKRTKIMQNIST